MQSEFEFISNLKKRHQLSKIGDDAAVFPKSDITDLVISADLLVENVDFKLDWSKPEFIGHKSLAVSISDISAMGAKPLYSMVSIGIPKDIWSSNFVKVFYEGYLKFADDFEVELIGGDISETPSDIIIDSVVLGEVERGKARLRSTAQPGDKVFVTGELGGADAGLQLLENGNRFESSQSKTISKLLRKQLTPVPKNGKKFVEFAHAMIDISDGLSGDLSHICLSSSVGAKIFAEQIPIDSSLVKITEQNPELFASKNLDILDFALHGGEDFELLFTVPRSKIDEMQKNISSDVFEIGEITEDIGKIELITDGEAKILLPKSFQHF